jgi:glycosyltransferase involved in cell wall biosynthesis
VLYRAGWPRGIVFVASPPIMSGAKPKAIICTNDAWTLFHFRGSLMQALTERGFEVIAAGPADRHSALFGPIGVRFEDVPMSPAGLDPAGEFRTLWRLWRLYKRERPALVHHFSHKAILYGSLAARAAGVPGIVNTVNGLGTTLGDATGMLRLLQPLILALMRLALRPPARVTFQNREILDFYLARRLVRADQARVILGSGIDTDRFTPDDAGAASDRPLRFLMFSRMLWAKGVREYCDAAEKVRRLRPAARAEFVLIGGARADNGTGVDPVWLSNPGTIPGGWLEHQAARGFVEWRPHQEDMLPIIRAADVVVLPSYYPEGVPRSLLEAMACGKAIITTDTPGCREVVEDGVNGFLVKPKDAGDLARAAIALIDDAEMAATMGRASRRMVQDRFSDRRIIGETIAAYEAAGVAL